MKVLLVILVIWCVLLMAYGIGATVYLSAENEKLTKQVARLKDVLNDPSRKKVHSCDTCTFYKTENMECMRTYTFQRESDYCSDWQRVMR